MRPVALAIAEAASIFLTPIMCIVACSKYLTIIAIFIVMQVALSRCALAIAVGDPLVPLAPAPAPAPARLSPTESFLPSEVDIEGPRLSFGSIGSSGVVQLPFAPVGPDAQ